MRYLFLVFFFSFIVSASMFELRSLYFDVRKYRENPKNFFIDNWSDEHELDGQIGLVLDVDLMGGWIYHSSNVTGLTSRLKDNDEADQFRFISWEYELGLRPFNWLEIGWHHFSGHILDGEYINHHFPVHDALQIKLFLYKN